MIHLLHQQSPYFPINLLHLKGNYPPCACWWMLGRWRGWNSMHPCRQWRRSYLTEVYAFSCNYEIIMYRIMTGGVFWCVCVSVCVVFCSNMTLTQATSLNLIYPGTTRCFIWLVSQKQQCSQRLVIRLWWIKSMNKNCFSSSLAH